MITVVYYESPFAEPYVAEAEPGLSLAEIAGGDLPEGIKAFLDDGADPIARENWALTYPADGAVVRFTMVPGFFLAPIFAIIAAEIAAAATAVGLAAGTAGLVGSIGATIATTAITAGVSMALQSVMSLIMPQPSTTGASAAAPGAGARFLSLTSGQNSKSPYDVIPKLYGTFRIEPPLAGGYFTESSGNNQYLHVLLCLGYGPLAINGTIVGPGYPELKKSAATDAHKTNIKIGNTPSSAFGDIDWIIGTPEQIDAGKIYANDIDEQTLSIAMDSTIGNKDGDANNNVNVWTPENMPPAPPGPNQVPGTYPATASRTTSLNAVSATFDIAAPALYTYGTKGGRAKGGARFLVQYRKTGATGAWTTALFDDGAGVSQPYFQLGAVESPNPVRKTGKITFPTPGQYDIKITRIATFCGSLFALTTNCTWTALRSIQSGTPWNYYTQNNLGPNGESGGVDNVVLMAMRVKATGKLNGTLDTVSLVAQSVLPVYSLTTQTWTPTPTNNPAWAYSDALKGPQCSHPLTDDQLDLVGLANWAAACDVVDPDTDRKQYEYNWYHTSQETVLQRIKAIATTGRGAWTLRDSRFGVVRDADFTPLQLISPRNSREFSFERRFQQIPHALRVRYIRGDTWQTDERIVYDDGYAESAGAGINAATKYELIETQGVTNEDQAWKEGRYYLACLKLRPETYRVTMDIENLVLQRGDCALLAHDSLVVGLAYGRIISVDGSTLALDEQITIASNKIYAVRIRRQDGTTVLSKVTAPAGHGHVVTLETAQVGINPGDLFAFGEYNYETILAKVSEIRYRPDLSAELTLIPAAPGVVAAEHGVIPPWSPGIPPETQYPPIPVILFLSPSGTMSLGTDGVWRQDVVAAWSIPSSPVQVDQIQINHWTANADPIVDAVPSDRSQFMIGGVAAGETLSVQLRSRAPDGRYSDYSGVSTIVVGGGGATQSSVVLTVSPASPKLGQTVTLTAIVSGNRPTGSVAFEDGTTVLGTIELAAAVATFSTTALGLGTHDLTAVYSGDSGNSPALSNTVTVTVDNNWTGPPAAPIGLIAVGGYFQIELSWTNPFIGDYAVTEIWASQTNNVAMAEKVGEAAGTSWTFWQYNGLPLVGGVTWYFWARNRDTEDLTSDFYPATATGVSASLMLDPGQILDLLTNSITSTQLFSDLAGEIDKISGPDSLAGSVAARVLAEAQARGTAVSTEASARATADGALATQINSVSAVTNNNTAAIVTETQARTTADSALASQINAVVAQTNSNTAAIVTETQARTDADSAIAIQITGLQSSVNNNAAAIQSEAVTRASGDSALAAQISTVQTTVNGHTTSIQQQAVSINGLLGKWEVKVDNNGFVGGFGYASEPSVTGQPRSAFGVRADAFWIAPPSAPTWSFQVTYMAGAVVAAGSYTTGNGLSFPRLYSSKADNNLNHSVGDTAWWEPISSRIPFVVLTTPTVLNGVTIQPGAYLNAAMIQDAIITTAKIRDLGVTNAKIANLAVDNAKIANASITSAKIGSLQVGTLHIANASVSGVPTQYWFANSGAVSNASPTLLYQFTFTVYGDGSGSSSFCDLSIAFKLTNTTTIKYVRVYIDGSLLFQVGNYGNNLGLSYFYARGLTVRMPGNHTCAVYAVAKENSTSVAEDCYATYIEHRK